MRKTSIFAPIFAAAALAIPAFGLAQMTLESHGMSMGNAGATGNLSNLANLGSLADLGSLASLGQSHDAAAGLGAANPKIAADQAALDNAFAHLRIDADAHNAAAIAGDEAAIMTALSKLQSDRAALHAAAQSDTAVQAAKAVVIADLLALERGKTQLRADQIAGNQDAITADQRALMADALKLVSDLGTLRTAIAAVKF